MSGIRCGHEKMKTHKREAQARVKSRERFQLCCRSSLQQRHHSSPLRLYAQPYWCCRTSENISTYHTIISYCSFSLSACKGNSAPFFTRKKGLCLNPRQHLTTPQTIWYPGQCARRLTFCSLPLRAPPSQHFPLYLHEIHKKQVNWIFPQDLIKSSK